MKILLANPPCRIPLRGGKERYFVRAGSRWPFSIVKKREEPLAYLPFPFYLAYAASLLERHGFNVEVLDSIAMNQTEEEFLKKVKQIKPDLIFFETSTPTIKQDLALAREIKEKFHPIVCLAGAHASHFPEEILTKNYFVDYIFLREYELNFSNFCLAMAERKTIANLSGIAWRENQKIKIQAGKPIQPLDQLPMPAWHLFPTPQIGDPTLYWDAFCQFKPAVQLHASRGCPFHCNFCLWNQVIYQNGPYRVFSARRIADEMQYVQKRYGAREIYFDDDTFTGNKKQVLALCQEIKKRDLKIHWSVMGDAMITDRAMIFSMAQAGCIGMKFGVESGNQNILKNIGKPINFKRIALVAKLCAKMHIKTHATFTFGLFGETKKTLKQTLALAKNLDVDTVQFSINTPFPGTKYYAEAKEKKLLRTEDWSKFDGSTSAVIKFENLTQKEIEDYYCRASSAWLKHKLSDPRWIARQVYNSYRLVRGQGFGGVYLKIKRVLQLILS